MKSITLCVAALSAALSVSGQVASTNSEPTRLEPGTLVEVGPHERIWTSGDPNSDRRIVEIGTGMNFWDGQQWTPSDPSFEITEDAFVANRLQHKVRLGANLNAPRAVTVVTPDGITLHSTPIGIGLYDAASGQSLIIGAITNCSGVLVGDQMVVYENAFAGVCADVIYKIDRGAFSQDIVITGRVDPTAYGFPARTTRIQIFTEFYDSPPQPDRLLRPIYVEEDQTVRNRMVSPDLVDEVLGFGEFVLWTGRAATLANISSGAPGASVAKQFSATAGRTFLIESVEYAAIQEDLDSLPECMIRTASIQKARDAKGEGYGAVPPALAGHTQVASARTDTRTAKVTPRKGVVIDYVATIGGTISTAKIFQGDTTYFLSSAVTCNSSATLEPGVIFKYPTNANVSLKLNSTVICKASNYRPAIFTAADDTTVGDALSTNIWSGYTGTIGTNYYANPALWLTAGSQTLSNVFVRYAHEAIRFEGAGQVGTVSHAQLVNCIRGIVLNVGASSGSGFVTVNNTLIGNVQKAFNINNSSSFGTFYNCTVAGSTNLITSSVSAGTSALYNSIFANVTNLVSGAPTPSGKHNGFHKSPVFGTIQYTNSGHPFITVGAGNFYLPTNSPFLNVGATTNGISSSILSDLKKKTTFVPSVLTNTYTSPAILGPLVLRDTDAPDLGYHYESIDWAINTLTVTNTTLTLTNGVALATFGDNGIWLREGSQLISEGLPTNHNHLTRFFNVQEQPTNWGGGTLSAMVTINPYNSGASAPSAQIRFTDFDGVAASGYHLFTYITNWTFNSLLLWDSSLNSASFHLAGPTNSVLGVTNNLFERVTASLNNAPQISFFNNLYRFGFLYVTNASGSSNNWTFKDNLFDTTVLTNTGTALTAAYNGYNNMTNRFYPTNANDQVLTNFVYKTGPLGVYYHSSTNLIDVGSRAANLAGLFHYTTTTNQVKETNSTVDIGYHYPAQSPPGAKVVFITTDTGNQGNWKGVYGADGYDVILDASSYPSYATVTPTGKSDYTWDSAPTSTRALMRAASTNRIAACWYSSSYFDIALTQNDGKPHRIALYCLDWDTTVRAQTIEIRDTTTGAVYDSRGMTSFNPGKYLVWDISGNVTIRVTNNNASANAVLSGIFFSTVDQNLWDTDGDGIPDYLEDRGGNGTFDTGENSWLDPAPALSITGPTNGQVFAASPTNVAISVTASDNGSVTNVAFYNGTELLGNDTSSPYSLTWSNVAAGTYTLTAKGSDDLGGWKFSAPVTITVNTMPTVSITNPANGAYFIVSPTNILLEATASDGDGDSTITNVAFYSGAILLGQDTAAPYSLTWSNVNGSNYVLTARASDSRGAVSTSSVVNITVNSGLDFGTNNAYVTFNSNTNLQMRAFTLECWFKQTAAGVATNTGGITAVPLITKGRAPTGGTNNMNYFLGIGTNNVLVADFKEVMRTNNHALPGVTQITNGIWYHAAAAFNGTNLQLYLNGNLEATMAAPFLPAHGSTHHAALATTLDASGNAGGYFRGVMDEVRIWNHGRSQQQIRERMSAVIKNGECGLAARWGLDEAQGTSITNTASTNVIITGTITGSGHTWTNSAPYNAAGAILLVVGSTNATNMTASGDSAINSHLQSLGYFVTIKAATNAISSDADSKSLVLISSSVVATNVNTKFTGSATPVVSWRHDLYDDLGMVTSTSYYGTVSGQTQLIVVNPVHPLAGGFSGTVTVVSNGSTFAWGSPNANALKIATTVSNPTNYVIFGYEKGMSMPGLVAPARRVGLFLSDPSSMTNLNANGFALFDAALNWALTPPCPPVLEVMFVIDYSGTMTNATSTNGVSPLAQARNDATYIATNLNLSLDRAGLIAFVGQDPAVMLKVALTTNLNTITNEIAKLTNPSNYTRIDMALNVAQAQFTTNHIVGAQPIIMLFSDGEPLSSTTNATYAAAGLAKQLGARLISIGLGTNVGTMLMQDMASSRCDYFWEPQSVALADILLSITNSVCRLTTNQQPNVAMVAPTNGQFFADSPTNIFLAATASDPDIGGSIAQVTFYSGTNYIGDGTFNSASNRYEFIWENVTSGTYTLSARATDNLSLTASSASVSITINGSPFIELRTPKNNPGYTANATVPLSAYAVGNGASIAKVEFYQGTNATAIFTNTSPGAGNIFSNNWTGVINGTYAVYARATDTNGGTALSQVEVFTVNTNLTFPTVTITSPTNGQQFKAWANINITASATPSGQIGLVEFYAGTDFLGSDTNAVFTVSRNGWKPGQYTLTARATHTNGTIAPSIPVTITVKAPEPTSNGYWDPLFGAPFGEPWEQGEGDGLNEDALELDSSGNVYSGSVFLGTGPHLRILKWASCTWSTPVYPYNNNLVYALRWSGADLYFGGYLNAIGPNFDIYHIARLSGTNILQVGNGLDFEGASEPEWWPYSQLGVRAIQFIDGDLHIGGSFTSAGGDTNIAFIAKLAGTSTNWSQVGTNWLNGTVRAIAEFGDTIYVGGSFTNASHPYLAKLANGQWQAVGSGVNGPVRALTAHNGRLFVGGDFTTAGGLTNANCIACWDGSQWTTINNGFSGGQRDDPSLPYEELAATRVDGIAARGNDIYVTGDFTNAWNGPTPVLVNYVAKASWSGEDQTWSWSALDGGLSYYDGLADYPTHGRAIIIRERTNSVGYDVIVAGAFARAGGVPSFDLARWIVGTSDCPTSGPAIIIDDPDEGQILTGTDTTFRATATATGTNTIAGVVFFRNGTLLGDGTYNSGNAKWEFPATDLALGPYSVTAVATDSQTNSASSAPVNFTVKETQSTGPTVHPETFVVFSTGVATNLNVLANDSTNVGPLRVVGVTKWANPFTTLRVGSVRIGYEGTNLIYHANPYTFGTNVISYDVANSAGTNTGNATVIVRALPAVQIASPAADIRTNAPASLTIDGTALDYDGAVTNVALYLNGTNLIGNTTNPSFSFAFSTNVPGFYTFYALATDNHGYTNASPLVTVNVYNTLGSSPPVASISNLFYTITNNHGVESIVYPVIRDGQLTLSGSAYDPDNTDDAYAILLLRPDDPNNIFANLTPAPLNSQGYTNGAVVSGTLAKLDFSAIPNGIYDLVLAARGGGEETFAIVRVSLDTQLKVGRFTFSEQDLVIPVNGLPLTVIRTYDSFNPVEGDFGFNWTYAINDMDVVIDEDRQIVSAITALDADDPLDKTGLNLDLRVGGGRNVTLTLPDGTRTTFRFTFVNTANGDDCPGCVDAKWIAAPGVYATLTTPSPATPDNIGDNTLIPLPGFGPVWQAGGLFTPMDAFDFPKFVLTMQDGTKYELTRDLPGQSSPTYIYQDEAGYFGEEFVISYIQPHPNKPRVSKIEQRTGDIIVINPGEIAHYAPGSTNATRTVWFERDAQNRITAIRDPISGSGGVPVVRYVYNEDTGNLIQVHKLVDRAAVTYATNRYHYDHAKFPHFITAIDDAIGNPITRNEYDDNGRLIKNIDAQGNATAYTHNLTNKVETITDRLTNSTAFVYDARGNVTSITNALNELSRFAYDDLNNKTSEINAFNETNRFVFDTNSFLSISINALNQTNGFTHNQYGQTLTATDARGVIEQNGYDGSGNPIALTNAYGTPDQSVTVYTFDSLNLLTSQKDAMGNITTNRYDQFGNLTNVTVIDSGGTTLTFTSYGYDSNNNRTSQTIIRTIPGGTQTNVTSFVFDAQNRLVQTIEPDGRTNIVVFNELGKRAQTIDKLGRITSYQYDARGNLSRVTFPDQSMESYAYDAGDRRVYLTNQLGYVTQFQYDALGRLTNTILPDLSSAATVYDAAGRVAKTIDPRNVTTAYGYDAAGRRIVVTNGFGIAGLTNVTAYAYDANDNLTNLVDNLGRTNSYFYDALSRRTNVTFQDGTKIVTQYDALGRRTVDIDQANNTNKFGYDGLSRLTSVTNALGKVTRYQYDEAGYLTNQVDALNRANTFEYDALGRRIKHRLPMGSSFEEKFGYDGVGNLIAYTNFNGSVITNQFDVMNRLWKRWNGSTLLETYTYNAVGQLTNRVDASGTCSWVFDNHGQLKTNATPVGTLYYQYDANGNLTNLLSSTANGVSIAYEYDALNRLTNAIDNRLSGTKNTAYTFDGVGNLATLRYPNGITNLWQYDSLNRLTNLTWKLTGNQRGDFTYKLGVAGNRTNLVHNVGGSVRTNSWQYDALNRLTNEVATGAGPTGNLGYVYDDVANRTSRSGSLGSLGATNNWYDLNDRLDNDSVTNNANAWFDANGNTRTNGTSTYLYDWANRLTNANSGAVVITYSADGHRLKKVTATATNLYLVATVNPSGYAQVVEELSVGGSGTTNLSRVYTYGLDLISQRQISGTVVTFYGYDGLGSVRCLFDSTGAITNTYAYDAYGTVIASNAPVANIYLYTGEQYDPDLGLYYLRARYYGSDAGRFWTMDLQEGNQTEPLSLHRYLYASANPVNRIDPTGFSDSNVAQQTGTLTVGQIIAQSAAYYAYRAGLKISFNLARVALNIDKGLFFIEVGGAATVGSVVVLDSALGVMDRASQRWLNNNVVIVEGPDAKPAIGPTTRGTILEGVGLGPEPGYKGGTLEVFDGQNSKGVSFSAKTIGLATGPDLEGRVLSRIQQELQKLEGASDRLLTGSGEARIEPGSTKLQVTMIGIPENQARILSSPTFRAALLRYREFYRTWVSTVPIKNWTMLWTKK